MRQEWSGSWDSGSKADNLLNAGLLCCIRWDAKTGSFLWECERSKFYWSWKFLRYCSFSAADCLQSFFIGWIQCSEALTVHWVKVVAAADITDMSVQFVGFFMLWFGVFFTQTTLQISKWYVNANFSLTQLFMCCITDRIVSIETDFLKRPTSNSWNQINGMK